MIGMLDFRSFVLVPKVSEALLIFFPSLFSLCCSDWVILIIFLKIHQYLGGPLSVLLLSSSIKIFVSTLVFSVLKFSFVFYNLYLLFLCLRFLFFSIYLVCLLKHLYDGCFKILMR